jgi:epoxyqueuosine reductase
MKLMDNKKSIIDFCEGLGIQSVGFCKCRIFDELIPFFKERKARGLQNEFEEEDIEKRVNPFLQMKNGKTIISLAFPYMHEVENNSHQVYFSKYTWGRDYHKVVSDYLNKICEIIRNLGEEAIYFVDSNPLPERYIAYLCGVGFIGKNNMLITEQYGSYVFLGEIITTLNIEPDKPIQQKCGFCTACLNTCPTKSINNHGSCPNVCLSYITQKKHIEEVWFDKLDGRLFGCDSCQNICPYNFKVRVSPIKELEPFEHMKNVNLEELINIDNKLFRENYHITSCGWRGKNILQRNALISLASISKKLDIDINAIKSPYVQDYYNRLLKILLL